MTKRVSVFGLPVDAWRKADLLVELRRRLGHKQSMWIVTAHAEFLYSCLKDKQVGEFLAQADAVVADGIAVQWMANLNSRELKSNNVSVRLMIVLWRWVINVIEIVTGQPKFTDPVPEKITGVGLVEDLANLATEMGKRVFLLGAPPGVADIAAKVLRRRFPGIEITGTSFANPDDTEGLTAVANSEADIVLVAYGFPKQEQWIASHRDTLSQQILIGVGGTFDYLAGKVSQPPQYFRAVGLEWLWRFVTQPKRFMRIMRATFGVMGICLSRIVFKK